MKRGTTIPVSRWPAWLNAAILLAVSWGAIAALSLQIRPDAEIVAAVFPPWWSAERTFLAAASADAAIVRMTAVPSLLVVRPDQHDGLTRLHEAGVWFVMDPRAIAACIAN
jgi:hypothetical protein